MIEEKRGLAARIVGTGEAWLTELSTGELRRWSPSQALRITPAFLAYT